MFKPSNFIARYQTYAKTLKFLKEKSSRECKTLLKKDEVLQSSKKNLLNIVESSKNKAAQYEVLCVIHNKITKQLEQSKDICATLKENLKTNRFVNSKVFMAAVLFKSEPVTISGYSQPDYAIVTQLGIVDDTNSDNVENAVLSTVPSNTSVNVSAIGTIPSDISNYGSTNNPASLYDTQTTHTSIFDNMPEERNDLYTTFTNMFQSSHETSTHVSVDEMPSSQTFSSPIELTGIESTNENVIINDYFTIETPGVLYIESSSSGDTVDSVGYIGDGALFASNASADCGSGVLTHTNLNGESSVGHTDLGAEPLATIDPRTNLTQSLDNVVIEPIPEPPALPDLAAEAASQINALGEPTFASLGLGGWTPVGIVQNCLEYLHVSLGIPWWEVIALGTLVIRFAMFPLVIISQRNAAKMNNHLPQMQVIQLKMTEARQSGNQMEVARYSQELMMFMKEKNLNPFKNMIVPLCQMPIFVSFFMGLRQMANVPVESLRTGGMFWFYDLTVPDQFFALPVITSLTLWATIELGTDSARLSSQNLQTMKYVLRALPFVILPFTVNFPGAILCYWVASNFISLGQVGFLKIPAVRDYFKIDPLLTHDKTKLPIQNKGFVGGIKDSWTNIRITREIEERRRLDELQFQRAGKGPLVKTYKYDPTKQVKKTGTVPTKNAIKSSS